MCVLSIVCKILSMLGFCNIHLEAKATGSQPCLLLRAQRKIFAQIPPTSESYMFQHSLVANIPFADISIALFSFLTHDIRARMEWLFSFTPQINTYNFTVILKVTLSLGPSLVLQSLFHGQFECSHRVRKTGHHLMKLGISSQDSQYFILKRLDLMKNTYKRQ